MRANNTTRQTDEELAREVWEEITNLADTIEEGIPDLNGDTRFIRIILAAIKKGYQSGAKEMKSAIVANLEAKR